MSSSPMTESEIRAVLLMRAVEQAQALSADDAAWAGREARRQLGDAADPSAWLVQRARLGLARLAEHDSGLRGALTVAQRPATAGVLLLGCALAALVGLLGESLGASQHINLLAPPMLGLLLWNLGVYAVLAWRRLLPARPGPAVPGGAATAAWARLQQGLGRRLAAAVAAGSAGRSALQRFAADWLAHSAPLQAARLATGLHAAAAALALGAIVSMYARGLVFDYQAGWDSTFLQPAQVRQLLGALLGPASAIGGLPLPDAPALAGLRLSAGGGEGAAPWIHRWAITLALVVLLPRAGLAVAAALRARRLARQLPLPDDPALRRLLHGAAGAAATGPRVCVLPYSYQLDALRRSALGPALADWIGPGTQCRVNGSLPLGAEDELPTWWPAACAAEGQPRPEVVVLLFALTATPERETHGALVAALARALAAEPAPRPALQVVVDESGFRQRLQGPDAAQRLAGRRAAWQALLAGQGVAPHFVDLSGGDETLPP
jgi:hypothetical protein